ncbi:MAG: M23 family metallopeptidase, partial [Actinomycetota bacterium]|nr:M23 family metallopeptidase [Actinomycetota bacterium]
MRPRRAVLFGQYLTLVLAVVGAVIGIQAGAARAAGAPVWGWPLAGQPVVDRPFQPPASAWGAGHRGVDLRGELGEPVLSAGPGRVSYAGLLAGRGVVTVTHENGLRTTYEPLDSTLTVGDLVERGDVIGTLSTGHGSCRPRTT